MSERKFWMVVGDGKPNVRHSDKAIAENEAKRLARQHVGREFYVVEAISVHRKVDVESIVLPPAKDFFDVEV